MPGHYGYNCPEPNYMGDSCSDNSTVWSLHIFTCLSLKAVVMQHKKSANSAAAVFVALVFLCTAQATCRASLHLNLNSGFCLFPNVNHYHRKLR